MAHSSGKESFVFFGPWNRFRVQFSGLPLMSLKYVHHNQQSPVVLVSLFR